MSGTDLGKLVPTSNGTPTSQAQVSKWLRGVNEPDPSKWQAIADAVHRDVEEIFGAAASRPDKLSRLDELEARLDALIRIQGLEREVDKAVRVERAERRRQQARAAEMERADERRGVGRPRAVPSPNEPLPDDDSGEPGGELRLGRRAGGEAQSEQP